MCQCGFCGRNYTRRSHCQTREENKPVWKCSYQTKFGKNKCPNSKAIDESVIESAFLEMFQLLADNFEDVLDNVLYNIEEALQKDESKEKLARVRRKLYKLEEQRKKLTDIFIDDKITKEAYDEKYNELSFKIDRAEKEKSVISDNSLIQKSIKERMEEIRLNLKDANVLDAFDRIVFESIVEKIIIGDISEDGEIDPYKLTFVLRGMNNESIADVKDRYANLMSKD